MFWLVLLVIAHGIYGLPDGAPKSACSTLLPRHNNIPAQTSKSPYVVSSGISEDKIVARISSPTSEKFEGFVLQARSSSDPNKFVDGEFKSSQLSKTIDCFDSKQNTLTHANRNPKLEIIAEWIPREDLKEDVIFRATVAKQFDVFWTEIDSPPVKLGGDSEEEESLYEKCSEEEGCIGMPVGCVKQENCNVLLKYSKSPNGIHFSLHGPLQSSKYMAMALSEDDKMGEDSVRECIRDGTNVIVRESWNEGKSNTRTREVSNELYNSSFSNGLASCSWSVPFFFETNGQKYNLATRSYYVLLASGDVAEWSLKFHKEKSATAESVDFSNYKIAGEDEGLITDDSSNEAAGSNHPPVSPTPRKESSTSKHESTTTENHGSHLSICSVLVIVGLFFTTKENFSCILRCFSF